LSISIYEAFLISRKAAIDIQIIIFKEGFDLKPISRKGAKAQRRKGAKVETHGRASLLCAAAKSVTQSFNWVALGWIRVSVTRFGLKIGRIQKRRAER